jgi:V/A-type H+-transporting ATPase subunit A
MELPVRNEIIRAKSEIPNDKLDELVTIQNHLDDQMAELERMYRKDIAV